MTAPGIVRPGWVGGLLLLAAGCGRTGTPPTPRAEPATPNTIVRPGDAPPKLSIPASPDPAAVAFLQEFLAAARSGKASPAQLTDTFKKVVAPPVLPSDTAKGYSDLVAEQWLDRLAGRVSPDGLSVATQSPDAVVASAPPPAAAAALPVGRCVLRVVKTADGWKADWLHVAPPGPGTPEPLTGTGDELAGRFALAAFLETALTGALEQTEAVLSTAVKARVAPPLGGDDSVRGYNRTILKQKLRGFHGASTGYAVDKREIGSTAGIVAGDLLDPAGTKRPFGLKLVHATSSTEWRVDDFEPR